jgi:hypothetical protein
MPMPSVLFYIADILHSLLRVVPRIFLHTAQENCDEEQLKEVGQWCYENLSLIISDDIYLQTEKGVKKLNGFADSWPGSTCRLLLDNFETITEIAIKNHGNGEINEGVCAEALAVWEAFFLFNDAVTKGYDDNDPVAVDAHAQELDNLGVVFMAAYLEEATDTLVTVYMHIMACHMGDLVREWGGLMKWCSQGAEGMHQMTIFWSEALNKEGKRVSDCAHPCAHADVDARPTIT